MRFTLRSIAGTLALLGALAGAAWVMLGSELLRYRVVRIVGNTNAGELEIRHLADLPVGDPLVLLDLGAAVRGVEHHPWVRTADARRVFPDTVVIRVEERTPIAILQLGTELFLVDADGVAFTRATPGELDHPFLTGISPKFADEQPALARRIVHDGLTLISAAAGRGGLAESDISDVHFDTRAGYTLGLRNGGEVLLGFRDAEILTRLDALSADGLDLSRPHRVDLGSPQLAVVTPL